MGGCVAVDSMLAKLGLSADRKTAARVVIRASKAYPDPNAFGLPSGPDKSCGEGVTPFCEGCYADAIETQWRAVRDLMQRNYDTLLACGDVHRLLVDKLDELLAPWYVATLKRGLPLTFRIHWDGDYYSKAYAAAWAAIACAYPDVSFWTYTRRLWAPEILITAPNISVYASVDKWNIESWRPILAELPTVHIAACAETFDAAQELVLSLDRRRAPACPEGVTLPLVVGMSGRRSDVPKVGEIGRGACDACRLCIDGRADVRFATNKKAGR